MSIVPRFQHDVFVSYAHFDNEADDQDVRWVSRFQADLQNALRQRLGEQPTLFFDTRSFEAHEHVDFLIENVRKSAILLAILSPSYVAREFTARELQTFCERASHGSEVVTVELLPVEEEKHLALLRGRKRTPFWWKDRAEHDIPLRLTPKFNGEMYHERLQVLAHHIKNLIEDMRGRAPRPAVPENAAAAARPAALSSAAPTVVLAQCTDDLYDDSQRTRAYLEQFGVKVLPEDDYPQGGVEFAAAVDADLSRAQIFVQLLGHFGSRKPKDLAETYAQHQYEAAKRRGVKILQWRRPDLDLASVTHRDKPLIEGAEVLAIGLEEFKAEVLRALRPPEPKRELAADGDCHVFINADRSDKDVADVLLALFDNQKHFTAARPLYEGSANEIMEDLEANLAGCEALMMIYGSAPPSWVRAQLLRYAKLEKRREAPPRLKTLLLGPPAPKPDLGWSGGFDKIDCQNDDIVARVRELIPGLRP
ncbi:MAG: toll/interleukin-1 receptor domain-containing protein [Roseiarcus sp.]